MPPCSTEPKGARSPDAAASVGVPTKAAVTVPAGLSSVERSLSAPSIDVIASRDGLGGAASDSAPGQVSMESALAKGGGGSDRDPAWSTPDNASAGLDACLVGIGGGGAPAVNGPGAASKAGSAPVSLRSTVDEASGGRTGGGGGGAGGLASSAGDAPDSGEGCDAGRSVAGDGGALSAVVGATTHSMSASPMVPANSVVSASVADTAVRSPIGLS